MLDIDGSCLESASSAAVPRAAVAPAADGLTYGADLVIMMLRGSVCADGGQGV
jgi:hypothetical protein